MKSIKITTIVLSFLMVTTSCVKNLTDLNTDPNNPQTVEPGLLFKYSVKHGMGDYLTNSHLEYNGLQIWMMYFASRSGIEPGNVYPSPSGGDSFWSNSYINAMNNAQVIINFADNNPDMVNKKAAAIIWKTFMMHRITDLWGNVPYSQAFKGNPDLEYYPTYDNQKDIYSQMFSDLKNAVELFDYDKGFFNGEEDLIYNGDIYGWIKFANSLRLRLAIRISSVETELAKTVIEELKNQPIIESNEEIASFQFNSVFNKPLYEAGSIRYQEGSSYINPSKFLVDMLSANNDPRIPFYFEKTALSITFPFIDEYRGVPNLVPYNSEVWDNYNLDAQLGDPLGSWGDVSRIGLWFMNNTRPMPILSYSEVCFLQAEASLIGLWDGDATELCKKGIRAHFQYINQYTNEINPISDIQITNYLNSITIADLEEIITQKYILFAYENVIEAYADYRRTGFPILTDYYGNTIDQTEYPNRLRYPYSEYTYNRQNYLNAVTLQGPDTEFTKIWWDKN